jgi:hypothetical protein
MEAFVEDLERSGKKHRPEKYSDFRDILEQVEKHPNRRYSILKSIILNNLYGVDIMAEAVEICKLRLFLKLAAQVDPDDSKENLGLEPLPDIDFNIKCGNTLVGFATFADVEKALSNRMFDADVLEQVEDEAEIIRGSYDEFRKQQTEFGGAVTAEDKQELLKRLRSLEDRLNPWLAAEYGVDPERGFFNQRHQTTFGEKGNCY